MIPPLTTLALRVLQLHLPLQLDIPPQYIPIALRTCTASQLRTLEYYNPHLIPDTQPVWKSLLQHEFPSKQSSSQDYRQVYLEWEREREEKQRIVQRKARKWKRVEQQEREHRKIVLMEYVTPFARPKKKRVLDRLKKDLRVYH
jgi:hypothetical protein